MSGINIANIIPYETLSFTVDQSGESKKFKFPASWQDMSDCEVTNNGPNEAFVTCGDSKSGTVTIAAVVPGATGTLNSYPIQPGQTKVFNKNKMAGSGMADTCAGICDTGNTAALRFTSGRGS